MSRFAFGDKLIVNNAIHFVAESERTSPQLSDVRSNTELVIIVSRSFVATVNLGDDEKRVGILFHVAVGETARSTKFSAPYFKPNKVVRVVNDAHFVCLRVPNAHTSLVPVIE